MIYNKPVEKQEQAEPAPKQNIQEPPAPVVKEEPAPAPPVKEEVVVPPVPLETPEENQRICEALGFLNEENAEVIMGNVPETPFIQAVDDNLKFD